MSLEKFDKVFYINCEHRTDRKESIESVFKLVNFNNYERINAYYIPKNGALGCAKSHLMALKIAKEKNYKNVLILEDDFILNINPTLFNQNIKRFFNKSLNWDVLMLSSNLVKYETCNIKFLLKVIEAQTTSGYAVNNHYFNKLIENFSEAEKLLENAERVNGWYIDAIDQYWKKLQSDNWFSFNPVLGKQSDGYSDIEKREVNYGC
jgi:glycosyl transferase family 25